MQTRRLTDAEWEARRREREARIRALAIRIPEVLTPGMTFGELADALGVYLEMVCFAILRCNYENFPITLKHPEGRGVMFDGRITNDLGEWIKEDA